MSVGLALAGLGALGSAVGSILGAKSQADATARSEANRQENIANANSAIDSWQNTANSYLDDYDVAVQNALGNMKTLTNDGDVENYKNLRNNLLNTDYNYNFDQFDKSKYNVNDYVNQNKDQILADVGKAFQATAAGAGLGHSSGTAQGIMNAQIDKNESLLNDAYNRMNNERNFDYSVYQGYINNMQNKLNNQLQQNQAKMQALGSDLQFDQNQNMQQLQLKQDQLANRINLGNSIAQSKASLV